MEGVEGAVDGCGIIQQVEGHTQAQQVWSLEHTHWAHSLLRAARCALISIVKCLFEWRGLRCQEISLAFGPHWHSETSEIALYFPQPSMF